MASPSGQPWPAIVPVSTDDLANDPVHKHTLANKDYVEVPGHQYPYQLASDIPPHLWPINAEALGFERTVAADLEPKLVRRQFIVYVEGKEPLAILPAFLYTHPKIQCSRCVKQGLPCILAEWDWPTSDSNMTSWTWPNAHSQNITVAPCLRCRVDVPNAKPTACGCCGVHVMEPDKKVNSALSTVLSGRRGGSKLSWAKNKKRSGDPVKSIIAPPTTAEILDRSLPRKRARGSSESPGIVSDLESEYDPQDRAETSSTTERANTMPNSEQTLATLTSASNTNSENSDPFSFIVGWQDAQRKYMNLQSEITILKSNQLPLQSEIEALKEKLASEKTRSAKEIDAAVLRERENKIEIDRLQTILRSNHQYTPVSSVGDSIDRKPSLVKDDSATMQELKVKYLSAMEKGRQDREEERRKLRSEHRDELIRLETEKDIVIEELRRKNFELVVEAEKRKTGPGTAATPFCID